MRGSEWRRWEPHIHAPGTILNNQFGGDAPWDDYLTALEGSSPIIETLAATDYYVTDTYEKILRYKNAGRLPNVQLIFPNIELRLDVAAKQGFVNIHLLVCPDDPEHLQQLNRILARLQFSAFDDGFNCTRDDLIRLGKKADPNIQDQRSALSHGATQFKVNFDQLRKIYNESSWAKSNILIAVAGGQGDGTSGVRQAADATIRQEIEKFADVIFSSNVGQREFWLGMKANTAEQLQERYRGCKPCLHGSDAHNQESIGRPVEDRFSWIKGALTFDSLRQACIDPAGRAFVGTEPPKAAMPSQVISEVEILDATWAVTSNIPLNPGLVAIIGARGSGKTALADIIAAGCDAIPEAVWKASEDVSPSFLVRARPLVGNGRVKLKWGGGTEITRHLDGRNSNDPFTYPRARYLSQQFVEELCSSKGASEGLINEIERVIFDSHPQDQREGAGDFAELREHHTVRFRQAYEREAQSISATSEHIADELEKEALVVSLTKLVAQKDEQIKGYNKDLTKLVVKGTEVQAQRHSTLNDAAQTLTAKLQQLNAQRRTFEAMRDEVANTRATKSPEMLREAKARHVASGLNEHQWNEFLLVYTGNVDKSLSDYIVWVGQEIAKVNGQPPPPTDPSIPLIAPEQDLKGVPLAVLRAEMMRLEKFISADTVVRNQYATLAKRIATENTALQTLKNRLTDAAGAAVRKKTLQTERDDSYERLFNALINEKQALVNLYTPLMERLGNESGTLQKLSFTVSRVVNATSWAERAEKDLIDCRMAGPFNGRGSLVKIANSELKSAWETGSANDVRVAMASFIAKYSKDLLSHAPYAPTDQAEFRKWLKQFAHWLFSTDHVTVRYAIEYDGVDIRKLSPGTRGIVLLLLYLALDDSDDRPLIIDQPEENLDPKSVFDELVSLFIAAKSKRQVIIVTHNANLVVNTDADQIIVANAGQPTNGGLPSITYSAGGLEEAGMRKIVCDILEGGEKAFKERARRLRVRLER